MLAVKLKQHNTFLYLKAIILHSQLTTYKYIKLFLKQPPSLSGFLWLAALSVKTEHTEQKNYLLEKNLKYIIWTVLYLTFYTYTYVSLICLIFEELFFPSHGWSEWLLMFQLKTKVALFTSKGPLFYGFHLLTFATRLSVRKMQENIVMCNGIELIYWSLDRR